MKYLKSIWFVVSLFALVNYSCSAWELGRINLGDYDWVTFTSFIISILLVAVWLVWFVGAFKSLLEAIK